MSLKKGSRKAGKFLTLSIAILLVFMGTWGQVHGKANNEISREELQETFHRVFQRVKNDYVEEVSTQDLMFGAIRGMLSATGDEHTRFMDTDQYNELEAETSGKFVGLGIEISIRDDTLTVVSPIEDTPAMKAGLKPGDKIVEIEHVSTNGMSLPDAVKKLRGERGTKVNITVLRNKDEIHNFTIVRDVIPIKFVESAILDDGKIGYVRLKQFSIPSAPNIAAVLKDFKKKKVKAVVLDLRWNPGGVLEAAHKIANFFIEDGIIVSTRGRHKDQNQEYFADSHNAILPDTPLIILANEGSASASEIVTGAVKDHKRGIFIGTKTFGKGSVQRIYEVNNDYHLGIALTVQKYYTPNNISIHKKGIEPDIEVKPIEFTKEDERNIKTINEKNLLKDFVAKNPGYNDSTVSKFKAYLKQNNLVLSDIALRRILSMENWENGKRPVVELEFDPQLRRAIAEFEKQKI